MAGRQSTFQKKPIKSATQLMGRRALVTGASGFIGTHLCSRLLEVGVEVYALSRAGQEANDGEIHWLKGDLADFPGTSRLITKIKPDLIFNLAGYPVAAREIQHVQPSLFSNLVGTVSVLTAAAEAGCSRVILAGSLEEPETLEPSGLASSPYAVSKWASSAYARMFHALYQIPLINLRIFMVYGPGQRDIKKLIPSVILSLLKKQSPQLTGGTRLIDWIYVEDVVDAMVTIASKEGLLGKNIDIGSGNAVSIKQVVDQIVKLVEPRVRPSYGSIPDRVQEQVRVANVRQSTQLTGWVPRTRLREGLRYTVEWYKDQLLALSQTEQRRVGAKE